METALGRIGTCVVVAACAALGLSSPAHPAPTGATTDRPLPVPGKMVLRAVSADSSTDARAVGSVGVNADVTLVAHRDGSTWTIFKPAA